jgi:hypothetical protein
MLTHGVKSAREAGKGLVESPLLAEVVDAPANGSEAGFLSTGFISYSATQNSPFIPMLVFGGTPTYPVGHEVMFKIEIVD